MQCSELPHVPIYATIVANVQCVVLPRGSARGHALPRSRPSRPSVIVRSCHHQTTVLLSGRPNDLCCAAPLRHLKHDPCRPVILLGAILIGHDPPSRYRSEAPITTV